MNLSDDPSSLESLANTPGVLNAITAAANRAMADKDARLRRYVLSVFANLAAGQRRPAKPCRWRARV